MKRVLIVIGIITVGLLVAGVIIRGPQTYTPSYSHIMRPVEGWTCFGFSYKDLKHQKVPDGPPERICYGFVR